MTPHQRSNKRVPQAEERTFIHAEYGSQLHLLWESCLESELSIPSPGVPGFSRSLGTGDAFVPPSSGPAIAKKSPSAKWQATTLATLARTTEGLKHFPASNLDGAPGAEQVDRSKTKMAPSPPRSPHLVYQPCSRDTGFFICNIWTIISYEQQPHFNQRCPEHGTPAPGQDPWPTLNS